MKFKDYVQRRDEGVLSALGGGIKNVASAAGKTASAIGRGIEGAGKGIGKGVKAAKQYGRDIADNWRDKERGWKEFQHMKKKMKK